MNAFGIPATLLTIISFLIYSGSNVATQLWIAEWADADIVNGTRDMGDTRMYNAVYGVFIAVQSELLMVY